MLDEWAYARIYQLTRTTTALPACLDHYNPPTPRQPQPPNTGRAQGWNNLLGNDS